jgi:hypothetical protein
LKTEKERSGSLARTRVEFGWENLCLGEENRCAKQISEQGKEIHEVAEGMLRELVVGAVDLGSFVEVLRGCGKTFKTGDALDLANCLAQLLDDPRLPKSTA